MWKIYRSYEPGKYLCNILETLRKHPCCDLKLDIIPQRFTDGLFTLRLQVGLLWRIFETIKTFISCLVAWICYSFALVWNVCHVICSRVFNLSMNRLGCIELHRRRKLVITTVIPSTAPAILSFESELLRKRIRLSKVSSAKDKDRVLVICLNHSRLETDVDNALSRFTPDEYRKIFLVIVHSVPKKELPGDSSNIRLMRLDKFKEIAEIVDMAFYKKQGIYKCVMNDIALNKIWEFFLDEKSK